MTWRRRRLRNRYRWLLPLHPFRLFLEAERERPCVGGLNRIQATAVGRDFLEQI